MKALILRQNPDVARATSKVLIDKGFRILCVETLAVAHALIRVDTIDLLVMDERFDGQLTHSIALSGERLSPYISTIMLTDRDRADTDDLYDLIPCLYALAGTTISPHILGQLALAAVSNTEETIARVAGRTSGQPDELEPQMVEGDDFAGDPSYGDIAIAGPELVEFAAVSAYSPRMHLEEVKDPDVALMLQTQPFDRALNRTYVPTPEPA